MVKNRPAVVSTHSLWEHWEKVLSVEFGNLGHQELHSRRTDGTRDVPEGDRAVPGQHRHSWMEAVQGPVRHAGSQARSFDSISTHLHGCKVDDTEVDGRKLSVALETTGGMRCMVTDAIIEVTRTMPAQIDT